MGMFDLLFHFVCSLFIPFVFFSIAQQIILFVNCPSISFMFSKIWSKNLLFIEKRSFSKIKTFFFISLNTVHFVGPSSFTFHEKLRLFSKITFVHKKWCPSLFLGEEYDIYVGLQANLRYCGRRDPASSLQQIREQAEDPTLHSLKSIHVILQPI